MKFIILSLLVLGFQSAKFQKEVSVKISAEEGIVEGGRYDKCVDILTQVLLEAGEITNMIMDKEYTKIVPVAIKMSKNIYDDVVCWEDSLKSRKATFGEDPMECIMKHARIIAGDVQQLVADVKTHDFSDAMKQIQDIVSEVKAAQDCMN